jgi:hypothetical protein
VMNKYFFIFYISFFRERGECPRSLFPLRLIFSLKN